MTKHYLTLCLLTFWAFTYSQKLYSQGIPGARQFFHELVDSTQKKILALDKKADLFFTPTANDQLNHELTVAAINGIDDIQNTIESDTSTDNNVKIKFLRGLNEALNFYISGVRYDSMSYSDLSFLLKAFNECMPPEQNNESIEHVIYRYPYSTGNTLMKTIAFRENTGAPQIRIILLLKYCDLYKNKTLEVLRREPDLPFTDSLLYVAARRDPDALYNYAASNTKLASRIAAHPDKLVNIISITAHKSTGRQFFPFLDNIYHGRTSFEQIEEAMQDSVKYFKLLVKTQIDYADRLRKRDTPMAMDILTSRLEKKAIDPFINTINGLHDVNDERIRFKILEPFGPEDLYYMTVLSEEVIYTSSYTKGVYPRIWQRMQNASGDSLLINVRFNHFKKWIKMAANYNNLDDFLKRMNKNNAQLLMKAFVNNLDKTNSLEDAVDVANSYAAITDKNIQKLILQQVQYNVQQAEKNNNKKAASVYGILNTLFLSLDSTNHIDVPATLGIAPPYFMPNKNLRDTSGKIIVQQFFYGDKDGQTVFNGFLSRLNANNWKVTHSKDWVTVSSTNGVPVVVYANRPLDEAKNLDAEAQANLNDYLFDNGIEPSVAIHRGHSYWLPSTITQLLPSEKVVLLGSCGAYQSLDKILHTCPGAQIVASKQTGSGFINAPMITLILETLRQGKDLNWPQLWVTLSASVGKSELFDDYIPPHKNLGALFLTAYNRQQEKLQN